MLLQKAFTRVYLVFRMLLGMCDSAHHNLNYPYSRSINNLIDCCHECGQSTFTISTGGEKHSRRQMVTNSNPTF